MTGVLKYNLIRAAMAEHGITQPKLAEEIGISTNSLNAKLNGRRDFSVTEFARLTKCLSIKDIRTLFTD